ncbi:hypothetical protein OQA88_702 [Cercophora sp. LCS_1]
MKFSVSLLLPALLAATPAAGRPRGPNSREVPVRSNGELDNLLATSFSAPPRSTVTPKATSVTIPSPGYPGPDSSVETKLGELDTRQGFSITQIRNPAYLDAEDIPLNGLQAMMQAYAKFGTSYPPEITTAVRINPSFHHNPSKRGNQTGSVPAYPERNDFEYLSPVQIGTPPQTLNLAIDTGSADLWVMSSETPKYQLLSQKLYTPTSSATSVLIRNHSWSITYGDRSSAGGAVYRDRVTLGNITYPYQTVESAQRVSPAFTSDPNCSGILGLGMSAGNAVRPNQALTFMDNIRSQLKEQVFTADLRRQQPGRYNFGYVDEKAYKGEIGYAGVTPGSMWWQFQAGGYQVGTGQKVGHNWSAIADTGTSLLLVPKQVVRSYYAQVAGTQFVVFDAARKRVGFANKVLTS